MTCEKLRRMILDVIVFEMTEEMRDRMNHHLNTCPDCNTWLHEDNVPILDQDKKAAEDIADKDLRRNQALNN